MLENPVFWVAVSFACTLLIAVYLKLPAKFLAALDARSAKIKEELEQAKNLRMEAERILQSYRQKQAEYLKEAESMLEKAREDAEALRVQSQQEVKSSLDARMKNALERIAQEEQKAIADVRNHVVDIALAAARAIIIDHAGSASQDELLKLALADIERKVH